MPGIDSAITIVFLELRTPLAPESTQGESKFLILSAALLRNEKRSTRDTGTRRIASDAMIAYHATIDSSTYANESYSFPLKRYLA